MNNITNIIELECEHFILEVKYQWRKGHAGDYNNPPEEDVIDILKVYMQHYITEETDVIDINKRIRDYQLPEDWKEKIIEEIKIDIENFM
tara:strand:+ start:282 stop:551 length:270 start_codon:yes stop_codon:yes gene_type:complete